MPPPSRHPRLASQLMPVCAAGAPTVGAGMNMASSAAKTPVGAKTASRVTTQCWVVLKVYEEINTLEEAVLDGQRGAPSEGISKCASKMVADYFGFDASTVSSWWLDFETGGKFARDGRGKWQRELLIHEEDLQRKFHKWMVKTAREEKLNVEAALDYLNNTLLRPPHVSEQTLADYKISLPISNYTAWYWMRQSDAKVLVHQATHAVPHVPSCCPILVVAS